MATVRCPDCGQDVPVPAGARSGDLVECPNCARLALSLTEHGGRWTATVAHQVSCPDCRQMIVLPDTAKAGDRVACCGREYRLTFEYGAFAAEA
jgi:ribosomal protein S27E